MPKQSANSETEIPLFNPPPICPEPYRPVIPRMLQGILHHPTREENIKSYGVWLIEITHECSIHGHRQESGTRLRLPGNEAASLVAANRAIFVDNRLAEQEAVLRRARELKLDIPEPAIDPRSMPEFRQDVREPSNYHRG